MCTVKLVDLLCYAFLLAVLSVYMPKQRRQRRGGHRATPPARALTRPSTRAATRASQSARQPVVRPERSQSPASDGTDPSPPPLSLDQLLELVRVEVRSEMQATQPSVPSHPAASLAEAATTQAQEVSQQSSQPTQVVFPARAQLGPYQG